MKDPGQTITWRHRLEAAALRVFLVACNALPFRWTQRLAVVMAAMLHGFSRKRKLEARRRVREIFPDMTEPEVKRVAWLSMRNLALNAADLACAERRSLDDLEGEADHREALDVFRNCLKEQRGLIVALVHAGNWDLAGILCTRLGIPGAFIARRQKNPLTNDLLDAYRGMDGATVIDRDDPHLVRKILRCLKANQMVAILIDLRARSEGQPFTYLGKTAWLGMGLGLLAQLSGAPVVPIFLRRTGLSRHGWETGPVIRAAPSADKDAERKRVIQESLNFLSSRVLRQPDQYFWYNKRWVLQPFEVPADGKHPASSSV